MNWDAFQREALAEMGLHPCRRAVEAPSLPAGFPAALFEALQRAAGPGHAGILGLPGIERLPGNPQAKRALWPLLRRMRADGR